MYRLPAFYFLSIPTSYTRRFRNKSAEEIFRQENTDNYVGTDGKVFMIDVEGASGTMADSFGEFSAVAPKDGKRSRRDYKWILLKLA
jgi:hypothetical protein